MPLVFPQHKFYFVRGNYENVKNLFTIYFVTLCFFNSLWEKYQSCKNICAILVSNIFSYVQHFLSRTVPMYFVKQSLRGVL